MKPRFVLLALTLLLAARLVAQEPEDRAVLEAFRDSLATVSDSNALAAVEHRLIEQARVDRDNALLHLRLGFLALRVGDLGAKRRYEAAASEFEWARDLQPRWPYPWYGLGLAELAIGEPELSIVAGLQRMFGKDAMTKGALAFAHAAEVDPSFVRGLVELANTALHQRVNIKLDLALTALRVASATAAANNPEVLLWRGRVERENGDIDSAVVEFEQYIATGNNRPLGLLELARSQFVRGQRDGAAAYFEGAAQDDSVAVAEYRADLALIAPDSVLNGFDAVQGPDRAAMLRRFWLDRDRQNLRRDNERLREHYRRLYYAKRNFALVSTNRHYDIVERYKSGSQDFDDRGIIYIRHGEPTDRATIGIPGIEFNETWRYARAEGDLIFHFVAREDVQDYKLVESLYDVLGFSDALQARGGYEQAKDRDVVERLLQSRERISPLYSRLQGAGPSSLVALATQERTIGQRSIALGTSTDTYELEYPNRLGVRTDVMAVGRNAGGSLLQVTWAIPGSSLKPEVLDQGYVYGVRLRVAVFDALGRPVAVIDTTKRYLSPTEVPRQENLVDRAALVVPPGRLQYRIAVEHGEGTGTVLPAASLDVGRFDGSAFAVSSVVLGWRSANLRWVRAEGDTVFFNPTAMFPQNGEMELYYEVYGLAAGSPYHVQLLIGRKGGGTGRRLFNGGRPQITLDFEEQAAALVTHSRRSVLLDRLRDGSYILQLIITTPDGRTAERLSEFQVTKPTGR